MKHLSRVLQIMSLLGTWGIIYFIHLLFTEFTLVPWDTAIVRPEVGNLARTLNDFFEAGIGAFLPSIASLAINIWLLGRMIRHRRWRMHQMLAYNAMLITLLPLFWIFATMINNWLFPFQTTIGEATPYGYHRSVLPLLVYVISMTVWIRTQLHLTRDLRKRKHHDIAFERLATAEPDVLEYADESVLERGNLRR
jgi:hypothetical protein